MATNKYSGTVPKIGIAKNMFFPGVSGNGNPSMINQSDNYLNANIRQNAKRLNEYRGPVQLLRLKIDTSFWRSAINEAERPLSSLPYRVQMQQIFIDTVLNGHVAACMQRRKNLTLLKNFIICDDNDVEDIEATKLLKTNWFQLMRNYIADAQYYGYSLISFGDMVDNQFPNVQLTRRADVSPDRLVLASFMYIPTGIRFNDPNEVDANGQSYYDWSLYVPTASENGVSRCGYGLLYKVAVYEIIMRSIIGWNTDYIERYGQPTAVIKTVDNSEEERGKAAEALEMLGSSGSMIMDIKDEFEFVTAKDAGTGWQSYADYEARCKKTISSIILGHEDGVGSTPGKLGSSQGGKLIGIDDTPQGRALAECESIDSRFEEFVINNHLIPKLIKLGIKIPVGKKYKLKNDQEQYVEEKREGETALAWATIAKTLSDAGLKIDVKEFVENSGITVTEKPIPPPADNNEFTDKVKARLKTIYKS